MSRDALDEGQLKLALIPLAGLLVLAAAAGTMAGPSSHGLPSGVSHSTSEPSAVTPTPQPALTVIEEYDPPVEVSFAPADHFGYRFDDDGAMIDQQTLVLSQASAALADAEVMDRDGTRYLRMVSGAFDGYLVPISDAVSIAGG